MVTGGFGRVASALVGVSLLVAVGCQSRQPTREQAPANAPAAQSSAPAQAAPAAPRGPDPAAKRGGTLTMAIAKDITVMNPLVRTFSTDQSVRELMYESLLTTDEAGKIEANLAESWEVSPDARVYTFKIRPGIKFHNGQELVAEDPKFSIDYTLNPRNGAYGRERVALVERAEALDRYTLRITLKQPSAAFLSVLTDIMAFPVVPNGSVEEGLDKPPQFAPGTGPFKFVEWQPKQRIVFDRYDDYWGQKAYLDRVVLRPIDDATVRITALRAGDVDVVERTPYEWVKEIKEGKLRGFGLNEAPYAAYRHLVFNMTDPPFNDPKMRLAVAHAIDKNEIVQAAGFGFGQTTDQKYPKGHTWYIEGIPAVTFDPDKARALLREAGYNGQEIDIFVEQAQDVQAATTTVQQQLRRVGVNLKINVYEYAAQRQLIESGQYTFDPFMGSDFYVDPVTTYRTEMACQDPRKRASNFSGYCSPEMDALFEKAETELDPARRREIVRQIVAKKEADLPIVPLVFVPRFFAFRDYVKGFDTDQDGAFRPMGGGLQTTWLDK
jgi:peptide/nickel transport system substrate-binding protein